jgi:hypothetical protein
MLNSVELRLGDNRLYSVEARSDTVPMLTYASLSDEDIVPNLVLLGMLAQSAVDLVAQCQNHSYAVYKRQIMPLS